MAGASDNDASTGGGALVGSEGACGGAECAGGGAGGEEAGRQRKRGAELEQAIRDATVAELGAVGYGALTIESVAARAQTGKASIYRRWPTKQDLVIDSLCCSLSNELKVGSWQLDERLSTRDALLELCLQAAMSMSGERGESMRAVMWATLRDPAFAETFEGQFHDPRKELLNVVLSRGIERGEVRADAVRGGLFIDVLAGSLIHRYLVRRQPVSKSEITAFIDDVVMPALRP
ncbi:MAG TPA: TetR/AcrR family transcriptional regulator [Jatrophihabitans sp.]|nr:TetR/AcrR family transcriptional regulator [Jatrophihabitans sp.]